MAVYFLQEVNHTLPAHANYLTRLESPHYRTLKPNNTYGLGIEALFQTKDRIIDLDKISAYDFDLKNDLMFHFKKLNAGIFANKNYLLVDNDNIFTLIENIKEDVKEIKDEFGNIYLEFELVK